jgi:hypothetical protein
MPLNGVTRQTLEFETPAERFTLVSHRQAELARVPTTNQSV